MMAAAGKLKMSVGVVAQKKRSASRWIDSMWSPTAVVEGLPDIAPGTMMHESETTTTYFMGRAEIWCHRTETEAYLQNLESRAPGLYVVLRRGEAEDLPLPWHVHTVTASPYEAQDYGDSDEDIVERVAMPPRIAAAIRGFIRAHPVSPPFKKRKRRDAKGKSHAQPDDVPGADVLKRKAAD